MKELHDIVRAYNNTVGKGQLALATVVHTEGSSYRRPGARMLITETGRLTGAISGGCLEGDAKRRALMVMARNQPMVVTYDTTDEHDAKLGIGLGCSGIIHILIEPIDCKNPTNPVELIIAALAKRQTHLLCTAFSLTDKRAPNQGTCLLLQQGGRALGNIPAAIYEKAVTALYNHTPAIYAAVNMSYLLDVIEPIIHLAIAGAGNDVIPLVELASILGWQTTVVDGRPALATRERFPTAAHVIVSKYDTAFENVDIDHRTAVILMTHNYLYDLSVLKNCLHKEPGYIGVLGPKKKLDQLLQELRPDLKHTTIEEKLFGPVGLDIGAETSEEIALSIAAEIKAVFADKRGASLRNKNMPIHEQTTINNLCKQQ